MTLQDIKTAVRAGRTVHWKSDAYQVTLSHGRRTGVELWYIRCNWNGSVTALDRNNGESLIGQESDFYLA